MKLLSRTDLALRVLLLLALEPDTLHSIRELSRRYRVSSNHLSKLCHDLVKAGYVTAIRGRNGGLRLKLTPECVNIGAVVRDFDRGTAVVECFEPARSSCVLRNSCSLQMPLRRAIDAFFRELDHTTLADLTADRTQARQMRRALST